MDILSTQSRAGKSYPICTNHQCLARKGGQLRLKGSKRDWETGWRMKCSLLNVSINGPAFSTPKAKEVVKTAVANWLQKKYRTLQRPPISTSKDTTSAATRFGWPRHPVRFSCCSIERRAIKTCSRTIGKRSALGKEGLLFARLGLGFRQWQCMGHCERHWSLTCKKHLSPKLPLALKVVDIVQHEPVF